MSKRDLFEQIQANLKEALADADRSRREAQDEANSHIGCMESRYDTFKEEAQAMVAAQQIRMGELNLALIQIQKILQHPTALSVTDTIRVGCLVWLEDAAGNKRRYVLAPTRGGIKVMSKDEDFMVITPDSPLGGKLIGLEAGEDVEIQSGGSKLRCKIVEVQ